MLIALENQLICTSLEGSVWVYDFKQWQKLDIEFPAQVGVFMIEEKLFMSSQAEESGGDLLIFRDSELKIVKG